MKILVTGGAGYIGSTLLPLLLAKGHHVTVFDNLTWGVNSLLAIAGNKNLAIIKGDIRNKDHVKDVVEGKDAIVHLAAIVGYPACDADQEVAEATNVDGTRNITEAKTDDQILVYASTGSCYGAVDGICTEETKFNPLSSYGITKAKAEELVLAAGGVALRMSTLFGLSPRVRLDLLVNQLVYEAVVEKKLTIFQGWYRRAVLHVKDAARAFILAIENFDKMTGQAYNVGDASMNVRKIDIAHAVRDIITDCIVDENQTGIDNDKRDYHISFEKIEQFGYKREITIADGIREMVKVFPFLKHGDIIHYSNV